MPEMMPFRRALPLLPVLVVVSAAGAQDYFPLRIDATWSYDLDYGGERTATVAGRADVAGTETFEVVHVMTGPDAQTFHNYWTLGPDGDLWLHRAWNETHPYDVVYDPPILLLDGPLTAGKSWLTETTLNGGEAVTVSCQVDAVESVSVPAGIFESFRVSSQITSSGKNAGGRARHDLFGMRVDGAAKASPLRYFSDGVGLVKETDSFPGTSHRLTSWNVPTPGEETSWGHLKSLFR
jgi:hypothetical protein